MKRNLTSWLWCPSIAFSAVASALPLEDPAASIDLDPWYRSFPVNVSAANLGRAVSGDFTGDRSPDVWQQAGDHLVLFVDPSYMDVALDFLIPASSMTRFPALTPLAADRLLISDENGLSLVEFAPGEPSPLSITPLTLPGAAPSWAGVKSLACCDLDLDGDLDLMAIDSAGSHLLRLVNDGTGAYVAAANISLGSGAYEAVPMTYNVGEAPRFAVLTPAWFFVVRPDGVRARVIAANGTFGHLARIAQANPATAIQPDCVVWLRAVSGSSDKQVAVVDNGATLQAPVVLTDMDASAIFSGDMDGDGSDDFGVVTKNSQKFFAYFNRRDAGSLTGDRFVGQWDRAISLRTLPGPGADNLSTPVLADFNFDGKADFFGMDRNKPVALSIQTDPPTSPENPQDLLKENGVGSEHPCFSRGDFYPASFIQDLCEPAVSGNGVFMLSLQNPWNLDPFALTGWRLDLVVYVQAVGSTTVDPDAVVHYAYDLSSSAYRDAAPATATWSFPIWVDDFHQMFHQKYYVVLRPLPPNNATPLTEYVAGFTSEDLASSPPDHAAMDYLTTLPGSWTMSTAFDTWPMDPACPGFLASRKDAAGAVPLLRVPRFPTGSTPNPRTPQYPANPPAPISQPQQ